MIFNNHSDLTTVDFFLPIIRLPNKVSISLQTHAQSVTLEFIYNDYTYF